MLAASADFVDMIEKICRIVIDPVGAGALEFIPAVAA
jgi:hypothetical protein